MRKLITFGLILFASLTVTGQKTDSEIINFVGDASIKQLVNENTELLMNGRYRMSLIVADKLIEKETTNANFIYRKAYALSQQSEEIDEAIVLFESIIDRTTKKYDASSAKEKNAPIDAFYHLASCYHHKGDVVNAQKYYNSYISVAPNKSALKGFAELGLKQNDIASKTPDKSSSVKVKNMGSAINTKAPEYSPAVSIDGSALYFTSRRLWEDSSNAEYIDPRTDTYLEDIYVSYKDFDGEWEIPVRLDVSTPSQNEATISVSADEGRIYIYNDLSGNGDIYYSDFQSGRFETMHKFEILGVNTDSWEPHISVTPDGNTIYFVSDRKGGFGGRDIYRITKLPDGTWSEAYNLGSNINSPYDEDAPFIAIDNKTLYFASNNSLSIGGFDIFVSLQDDTGVWSTPINLGTPINSTGDDLYYTTTSDGRFAYITSFRSDGHGEKDIYEIEDNFYGRNTHSVLKGIITVVDDKPLPKDVNITVRCLNCAERNVRTVYPRKSNNQYLSNLDKCREYEMVYAYDDGKTIFHTEKIKTGCDDEYEEIYKPVLLRLDDWTIIPAYTYELAGNVTDEDSNNSIENVKIEILTEGGDEVLETVYTDKDGNYSSKVLENKQYGDNVNLKIRMSKEGYLTSEIDLLPNLSNQERVEHNLSLEKLDLGKDLGNMLALNTIYFDLNKADIREEDKGKLDKIVKILNENPTLEIELGSHTDCRASKAYNQNLSDRRARNTASYIKGKITNPSRIKHKGYGETKLINNCPCEGNIESECSEEQHQLNRRTEFKIIKL